jgi:hypothetical protein
LRQGLRCSLAWWTCPPAVGRLSARLARVEHVWCHALGTSGHAQINTAHTQVYTHVNARVWVHVCREFRQSEDMYAQDSIDLLKQSGIDFAQNETRGIDVRHFGELLMVSGVVLNEDVSRAGGMGREMGGEGDLVWGRYRVAVEYVCMGEEDSIVEAGLRGKCVFGHTKGLLPLCALHPPTFSLTHTHTHSRGRCGG